MGEARLTSPLEPITPAPSVVVWMDMSWTATIVKLPVRASTADNTDNSEKDCNKDGSLGIDTSSGLHLSLLQGEKPKRQPVTSFVLMAR